MMRNLSSVFLLLFSFNILANTNAYQKGLHYSEINPAHDTGQSDKVVVYEFFSYRCGHCATFEPYMKQLQKDLPEYATIVRIPLGLQSSWKAFAQAFYAAEQMGLTEQSHQAIFDALHKERTRLNTLEDIAQWFETQFGTNKEEFIQVANSFSVANQLNKGNKMAQQMLGMPRTPTLVIDGKFKPETSKLGSFQAVIELTKQLVEAEGKNKNLTE